MDEIRITGAHTRTTIWLGDPEAEPEQQEIDLGVHTEDNMAAVETVDEHGAEIQVLIARELFPNLRRVMDIIDRRFWDQQI